MSLATESRPLPDRRYVRTLLRVLAASVVLTTIHYTDNYLYFDEYPQPGSLQRWQVWAAWLLLTAVGVAGYALYRRGYAGPAYVCLVVYSYTGLSSLGHYLYGSLGEFSAKQHAFIAVDGLTGASVIAFVVWSALTRRRDSTPAVGGIA